MLASFRSALLICAALTASTFTPAKAGPATETLVSVASKTLPKVSIPDLLDPQGEPQLSVPAAPDVQTDEPDAEEANLPEWEFLSS